MPARKKNWRTDAGWEIGPKEWQSSEPWIAEYRKQIKRYRRKHRGRRRKGYTPLMRTDGLAFDYADQEAERDLRADPLGRPPMLRPRKAAACDYLMRGLLLLGQRAARVVAAFFRDA
jgi:hypothetical protein